ncbi:transglutaminaseTgpA domain-containing protein [Micromonospora palythoicola]|uniref:transglutaminaseTgpA domain-containing protein n=1 Tax=Micromonospora palythoicola TaxID=3120507 RepID=UPI0038CBFF51
MGRGTPVVRLLRAVAVPATLVVLVTLAGVVLGRVYAGSLLTMLVAGAAVGSVLVSVVARRLPSWLVAPVSVLAMLGWTAVSLRVAATDAQLPGGFVEVAGDAAGNAIPRLLTAMIPVQATPDTVLLPVVAAWLAGLAGAEVALRAGRVLLGYLPPVLLHAGAVYVVGPNAEPAIGATVAVVVTAALGLAVSSRPPDGDPVDGLSPAGRSGLRARLAVASAAGTAVVVALAALLGPAVAALVETRPVDPRRYVQPPQVETLDENPLIRISGWALNPEQELFQVATDLPGGAGLTDPADPGQGTAAGDAAARIRLAVLSDYDGVTWRVGATYRNAGRVLPATEPAPYATVETVRQEITVGDLSGRLLPAVPTPREVSGARVAYDPGTGTLIRPEGLTPGLRYAVTSARERPDNNLLATANTPAGDAVARVLHVPDGAPEQLRRLATQLAEENGAPYARAAAIEQWLAEHYRLVADAPSGHAYPNLAFFLFGPRNGGGQRGTSEQFAASFAVLGRLAGLPTRVAVGFAAPSSGPVRAADAYAWPEVLFDGLGWVAFDPLPRPDEEPRPVEEDFRPQPEDPPPSEQPEPTLEPTASSPAQAAPGGPADGGGVPTPVLVGGTGGGLLLVVVALLVTLAGLRRAQTRARLHRGDPGHRIAGAWRELTDTLRLAGQPVAADLSATEVAAVAGRTLAEATRRDVVTAEATSTVNRTDAENTADEDRPVSTAAQLAVDDLATLINQVGFAPGTATAEQAEIAAEAATTYSATLRAAHPLWRRLLWAVHPGPLRWPR